MQAYFILPMEGYSRWGDNEGNVVYLDRGCSLALAKSTGEHRSAHLSCSADRLANAVLMLSL